MLPAILLISALVVGWLFYVMRETAESYELPRGADIYTTVGQKHSVERIPKMIWSFWHSEEKPLVAQECLRNWQACNPEYQVNMLHASNIKDFLPDAELPANFQRLRFQQHANWVRLALLEKYGGVWLDSSLFLTTSLDRMLEKQQEVGADYFGFHFSDWRTPGSKNPVIENWFMAATASSPFIRAWRQEYATALEDGPAYMSKLKADGRYEETVQNIYRPEYFSMHVAGQSVLRDQANWRLCLINADDLAFFYHVKSKWNLYRFFWRLLFLRRPDVVPALIKLRGRERRKLEKYLRFGIYRKSSIVGVHLAKQAK